MYVILDVVHCGISPQNAERLCPFALGLIRTAAIADDLMSAVNLAPKLRQANSGRFRGWR